MPSPKFLSIVLSAALLTIGSCEPETSVDRPLRTRQVHAEGSELFTSPGVQGEFGEQVDRKSLAEIQEDLARLTTARSALQELISKMSGILGNINSKSADITQYSLGGAGYYPVDNFVKFYKNTYGYNGYPNIAGIPCAGIPTVNTLPTIPVLIKRITADTTYLMNLYNRGIVTTTTNLNTHVQGVNTGLAVPYDTHHH